MGSGSTRDFESVPPPTSALARTGGGRRNPLSRNEFLRFQRRGGTPGVLDGRERRGCREHAHASGGCGLVVETPWRRPRLRGLDDQTPATPRRRRSDWVRSVPPYPSSVTGLAPRNWLRSARRVRFVWRARWLGRSPLTGRAPLSCNHEGWSACRHAAGGFVRRGGAGAPTACLASGSGLTLIRIARTPGALRPRFIIGPATSDVLGFAAFGGVGRDLAPDEVCAGVSRTGRESG